MYNKKIRNDQRPDFPKRAIITAGMPYGNKHLHFGHVGGMFIHADTYARFLKDRIGQENVIFVSGTDCYGSPILESYRKIKEEGYEGTIEDYVRENHIHQKNTLEAYDIKPDLYGASALDEAAEHHRKVSNEVFEALYKNHYLRKMSTPQFYDAKFDVFLNGRQVVGRCPISGCSSDKGYADECSLGHQYMPSELINPVSMLSGEKPIIKEIENWYFCLEEFNNLLIERNDFLKEHTNTRRYQLNAIEEFLKKPYLYVQRKNIADMDTLRARLPEHSIIDEEKKPSIVFVFDDLNKRDAARAILDREGIHYRTGKTLVPFRLSGNIDWGVKIPDKDGMKDRTFWVWPESLWAPISFTRAYLAQTGRDEKEWLKWWDNDDAMVYQFIGEDNIYFYGIAEMAIFAALKFEKGEEFDINAIHLPHIIANNHVLFMDTKASSSSEIKPPMADELLEFYTPEQLRMHFLSLGLSNKSVGFKPQIFMPESERQGQDFVLKEGNLLTNVFNRIARSCFYTVQQYCEGKLPHMSISEDVIVKSKETILEYELHMYNHDFHKITYVLDTYIRDINKYWSGNFKNSEKQGNINEIKQIIADCFYYLKIAATLLHPLAPSGCEKIKEYLNVDEKIWDWNYIFEPLESIIDDIANHELKFLQPREDFFKKLESQFN